MVKSYYLTITQYENLGDLVINKMLLEEISRYSEVYLDYGDVQNSFIDELKSSGYKHDVFKTYGLSLHSRFKLLKTLLFIKKIGIKYFFVSPGPKNFSTLFSASTLGLLFVFLWCKLCGIKAYYIGVDLRNRNRSSKIYNSLLNIFLEKIYLRDTVMIKKINKPNIEYIPDVALLFDKKVKTYEKENLVLVSFRKLDNEQLSKDFEEYLDSVIKYYSDKDYKIKFFYQVERDRDYNVYLYSKYKGLDNVSLCKSIVWYGDIESTYASSSVVVSNRMHVLLLGLIYRSNIITMPGDRVSTTKISYVFNSLGLADSIYDINEKEFKGLKLDLSIDEISKLVHDQRSVIEDNINNIFR